MGADFLSRGFLLSPGKCDLRAVGHAQIRPSHRIATSLISMRRLSIADTMQFFCATVFSQKRNARLTTGIPLKTVLRYSRLSCLSESCSFDPDFWFGF